MQALVHAPVVRPEVHVAVLLPVGTGFGQRRQALGFQPLQGRLAAKATHQFASEPDEEQQTRTRTARVSVYLGEVVAGTVLGVTAVPERASGTLLSRPGIASSSRDCHSDRQKGEGAATRAHPRPTSTAARPVDHQALSQHATRPHHTTRTAVRGRTDLVLLARGHAVDDKGELCLTLRHAPHLDVCAWIHHAVP
eukprot:3603149-Rhodomonas_salina.6